MNLQKTLNNYIKNRSKDQPEVVSLAKNALKKSGFESFELFFTDKDKFVLLDVSKDVSSGVIVKNESIVDFKNSDDFLSVSVNAYARYNILKRVSDGKTLEKLKDMFSNRRTWVILYVKSESEFNAHTHGLDVYSHPDLRIKRDIGKEEVAYLLNSLAKSIQKGNSFRDKDTIVNLYENCNIVLTKADDGLLDVNIVSK